jgi:ADP-ribosylation factor protein 6
MGGFFSKLYFYWAIKGREFRIVMVGLDGAGKTTILNQMKLGEPQHTVPTIGFNLEKVSFGGVEFNTWDIGGQQKIRPLWEYYLSGIHAVIFVIDSADTARLREAMEELEKIRCNRDVTGKPFVIFANKQDLPGAIHPEELFNQIRVLFKETDTVHVFPVSAIVNEGITEGMVWLLDELCKRC